MSHVTVKRTIRTRVLGITFILTLVFGLLSAGASTALATEKTTDDCHHHGQVHHPHGKGEFEPIPREEYTDQVDACGTTVTITTGDVWSLKVRTTTLKNGYTLEEIKGGYTNDLTTLDGRNLNEVNNSGPYEVLTAPDGTSTVTIHPPALIYPFNPGEPEVFEAAGLPQIFTFTSGTLVVKINADGALTQFVKIPKKITNVCKLFKKKGGASA